MGHAAGIVRLLSHQSNLPWVAHGTREAFFANRLNPPNTASTFTTSLSRGPPKNLSQVLSTCQLEDAQSTIGLWNARCWRSSLPMTRRRCQREIPPRLPLAQTRPKHRRGNTKIHVMDSAREVILPPMSVDQLCQIFGKNVNFHLGNGVLRKLHQQRVSGRLDEAVDEAEADAVMVENALQWLRERHPIDEEAAMNNRVEEEEGKAEQEAIAKIQKLQNWKPQDRAEVEGIYGRSAFEELRKEKKQRRAKREEEMAAYRVSTETAVATRKAERERALLDRRKETTAWVQKHRDNAQMVNILESEKLSAVQRLIPSAAFVAVLVGGCILCAAVSQGQESNRRVFTGLAPASATVLVIAAANVAVFLAWRYPPLWRSMNRYFLLITAQPNTWSLLGSTFSHQQPVHLLVNMLIICLVGRKRTLTPILTGMIDTLKCMNKSAARIF